MPRICEFYGIVVAMYYDDHGVPHFHAFYSGDEASIAFGEFEILKGSLPARALRLLREWVDLHRDELMDDWQLARDRQPLRPIDPLH